MSELGYVIWFVATTLALTALIALGIVRAAEIWPRKPRPESRPNPNRTHDTPEAGEGNKGVDATSDESDQMS